MLVDGLPGSPDIKKCKIIITQHCFSTVVGVVTNKWLDSQPPCANVLAIISYKKNEILLLKINKNCSIESEIKLFNVMREKKIKVSKEPDVTMSSVNF